MRIVVLLALLLGLAAAVDAAPITVTLPDDVDPAVRAEVLAALGAAGAVVDTPDGAGDVAAVARLGTALEVGFAALPDAIADFVRKLATLVTVWHWLVLAAALALGLGAERWLRRRWTTSSTGIAGGPFRARLRLALPGLGVDLVAIAAFVGIAVALAAVALPAGDIVGRTVLSIPVVHVARLLVLLAITRFVVAPAHPERRLAPFTDAEARSVFGAVFTVLAVMLPLTLVVALFAAGLPTSPALPIVTVAVELVNVGLLAHMFWRIRQPVGRLVLHAFGAGQTTSTTLSVRLFAANWHIAYTLLAILKMVAVAASELGGADALGAQASANSLAVLILLPFVIGGINAWFADRPPQADDASNGSLMLSGTVPALLKGLVLLAGLAYVARSWGMDPFSGSDEPGDRLAHALFHAALALLVGWAMWRGVRTIIANYSPLVGLPETGDGEAGERGETLGRTGSRIETLLPVIQSAAFALIVVMSGLTALSALGVNIGPLLAGAGVVGLAIGFGAQTLVRDVITGAFYLVEDAFRVGEYVVCGAGKGMVEKISLRSVRLRHHRGPIYTIPFGSMGTVQNHSRDWVKIKLMLRVPLDVDLEKVRRTIKKVGVDLAADPEFGDQFLEPVKSQGVVDVDDSAFIIAVKYVCRPGQQFVLRRHAYARIQQGFHDAGIAFAPRKVVVDTEHGARVGTAGAAAAPAPVTAQTAG